MSTDKIKTIPVTKEIADGKSAVIKAERTDKGGTFYVFDVYDAAGTLISLNRYCMKNSNEQPFEELNIGEEGLVNGEVPDDTWDVPEIKLYLDGMGIEYTEDMTKEELIELAQPELVEGEVI